MSKVVLVANGDNVYAVPTDICEKYALTGDELDNAKNTLSAEESDVEGQMLRWNSRNEAYTYDSDTHSWSRAPWYD